MARPESGRHPHSMTAQLVDLSARRRRGDAAVARVAAAPVRHVSLHLLAEILCVDAGELDGGAHEPVLRLAR